VIKERDSSNKNKEDDEEKEKDPEQVRKDMEAIDDALRDEDKVTEAMKKIAKEEITERMESAAQALTGN
jgi:hypothetical protein